MTSPQRISAYAICLSLSVFASCHALIAKENKESATLNSPRNNNNSDNSFKDNNRASGTSAVSEFQWSDHPVLSWGDFQGAVNAASRESAAATHCGIGFRAGKVGAGGKPGIVVYNTFYINKSWVKPDAKMPAILLHEQGHFDLCEIYTRALKSRMADVDMNAVSLKSVLEEIYFDVKKQYERRQQAYEDETVHGTNFAQQQRWHDIIARELTPAKPAGLYVSSN